MDEHELIDRAQAALGEAGVDDVVTAAVIFLPRGHFAGAFAGGLAGDIAGGGSGLTDSIATVVGAQVGMHESDKHSGMPDRTIVAVSESRVYGFDTERGKGGRKPTGLIFAVNRPTLKAKVHQRFNVRVLELEDGPTGHKIELEGPRMPGFHAGDVIDALHNS
jgi:hypothetical protein